MTTYHKLKTLLSSSERRQLPILLIMMFISMGLEIIGIGLIIPMITLMTRPAFGKINISWLSILNDYTQTQLIIISTLVLVGAFLFKTLFLLYMLWKQNKFIYGVGATLSNRLFNGYLHQPWTFHLERNSAQLILNVTTEVAVFTSTVLQNGMALFTEGSVLLGVTIFLFIAQPLATVAVIGVLGSVAFLFQRVIRNYLLRWGEARQLHEGRRIQHLQQGLGGVKDVKLLGRELDFFNEYRKHNMQNAQFGRKQKTLSDLPKLWLELLGVIGLAGVVLVVLAQHKSLDALLPTLGLFAAAAFRLMPSLNRIMSSLQSIRYGMPAINTLYNEVCLFDDHAFSENKEVMPFKRNIALKHIQYRYSNAPTSAVNDVSLVISRGASVGFIGASGAGKSSLIDIILGLLTPDAGQVTVDDIDIQDNLRGWQDKIGYVPQSIYLTDDSIRRNVAFGIPNELIDDLAVQKAIKAAQLDHFIENLPQGVETLVGERGVRLSGGQRQRIGIARALYHEPEVLVLDEATSSLDAATEKEVMRAINALQGSKTLIIIAHRLSTVSNCDWIYSMKNGQIINCGKFDHIAQDESTLVT